MRFEQGLSLVTAYFSDERVSEVLLNSSSITSLVLNNEVLSVEGVFPSDEVFLDWVFELAEQQSVRLDAMHPSAGGVLPEYGFRWHAVLPPISGSSPLFSLRRLRFDSLTLGSFADEHGCLTSIAQHIANDLPLLVCGLTGSGKSSFLSALAKEYLSSERIAILEVISELALLSPKWIHLSARTQGADGRGGINLQMIFDDVLRLRPDRIIVGEIRAEEVRVFAQSLSSFTRGSLATMHAGSLNDAFRRYNNLMERYCIYEKSARPIGVCLLERAHPPKIAGFRTSLC